MDRTPDLDGYDRSNYKKHFDSWIQRSRDLQRNQLGEEGMSLSGVRSAAPIGISSMKDLPKLFKHFWANGTTMRTPPLS